MKGFTLGATVLACYGFLAQAYNVPLVPVKRIPNESEGDESSAPRFFQKAHIGGLKSGFHTGIQAGSSNVGISSFGPSIGIPAFSPPKFPPVFNPPIPTIGFTKSQQNSFLKTGFSTSGSQNSFFSQSQGSHVDGSQGGLSTLGTFTNGHLGISTNGAQIGTSGSLQGSQSFGTQGISNFGSHGGSVNIGNQGGHLVFPHNPPTSQGGSFHTVRTEYFSTNQGSSSGNQGVSQSGGFVSGSNKVSQSSFQSGSAGGIHKSSYGGAILGPATKPVSVNGGQVNLGSQQTQVNHGAAFGGNFNQANHGSQQTQGDAFSQGHVTQSVVNTATSGSHSFNNAHNVATNLGGFGNSQTQGGHSTVFQSGTTNGVQQDTIKTVQDSSTGVEQTGNLSGAHGGQVAGGQGVTTNVHHSNTFNNGAQGSSVNQIQNSFGGSIDGSTGSGGLEDTAHNGVSGITNGAQQNTIKVVQESFTGGAQANDFSGSHFNQANAGQGSETTVHKVDALNSGAQGSSVGHVHASPGSPANQNQNTVVNQDQSDILHQHTDFSSVQQGVPIHHGQNVSPTGQVTTSSNDGVQGGHSSQNQGSSNTGPHGGLTQQPGGNFNVVQETDTKTVQEGSAFNNEGSSSSGGHVSQVDVVQGGSGVPNNVQTGGHTGPSTSAQSQPVDNTQHTVTGGHEQITQAHNGAEHGVSAGPSFNVPTQHTDNPQHIITGGHQEATQAHNGVQTEVHASPSPQAQPQPVDNTQHITTGGQDFTQVRNNVPSGVHGNPSPNVQPQSVDNSQYAVTDGQIEVTQVHNNLPTGFYAGPTAVVPPQPQDNSQHVINGGHQTNEAVGGVQGTLINQGHGSSSSGGLPSESAALPNGDSSTIEESTATVVVESSPTTNYHGDSLSGSDVVRESVATVVGESSTSNREDSHNAVVSGTVLESTATVVGEENPSVVHHPQNGHNAVVSDTVHESTATVVGEESPSVVNHPQNSHNTVVTGSAVHGSTTTVVGEENPSVVHHPQNGHNAAVSETVHESTATIVGEESPSVINHNNLNSENPELPKHDDVGQSQQGLKSDHQHYGNSQQTQQSQDNTSVGNQYHVTNSGKSVSNANRGSSGGHAYPVWPAHKSSYSGNQLGTAGVAQENIATEDLSHGSVSAPVDAAHNGQTVSQFQGSTSQVSSGTEGHNLNVGPSPDFHENSDNQDTTYGVTSGSNNDVHGGSYGQEQAGPSKTVQESSQNIAQQSSVHGGIPLQSIPGVQIHSATHGTTQQGLSSSEVKGGYGSPGQGHFQNGFQSGSPNQPSGSFGQTQGSSFGGSQSSFKSGVTSGSTSGYQSYSTAQQGSTSTSALGSQGSSFTISQAGPNGSLQTCQCTCQDANNPIFSKYTQNAQGSAWRPKRSNNTLTV